MPNIPGFQNFITTFNAQNPTQEISDQDFHVEANDKRITTWLKKMNHGVQDLTPYNFQKNDQDQWKVCKRGGEFLNNPSHLASY